MEKKIIQLEGCFQKMELTVPKSEIQPYYDKAYNNAKKNVNIKGFRRGKVPMKMIKQFYGPSIDMEAEQEAINELFPKITGEENIAVLNKPSLTNVEKNDDNIIFSIEYETLPDFQLEDYKNLTIDEPVHSVEDEEIEKEIDKIKNENADFEVAQKADGENYVIGIKMEQIDAETKVPIVGGEKQEFHVYLQDEKVVPELKESLIGKSVNDQFEFTPPVLENQEEKTFKVTVNDIQRLIPKELTSEFIKEYTKDRFDNIDDLKEEIGFQLQEKWDQQSREKMEQFVINELVEMHENVPLPEDVVDRATRNIFDDFTKQYQNAPKDTFDYDKFKDNLRPIAERNVKYELIRNKIIEAEDIKVEEYDITPYLEDYMKASGMDEEEAKKQLMDNEGFLGSVLNKKVMDLILEFSETREVDFDGNPLDEEEEKKDNINEENSEEINNKNEDESN